MESTEPRRTRSLGTRFFLATALAVAVAVAVVVSVASAFALRMSEQALRETLRRSSTVQAAFQTERFERLRLVAERFAADPYIAGYVIEAIEAGDSLSILDQLDARRNELGFDFAIIFDPKGGTIVRTDAPFSRGEDLSGEAPVVRALENLETHGVWAKDERLYYAVAVPLATGGFVHGYLLAGFAIDNLTALEHRQVSDVEVYFFAATNDGLRLSAGTLDPWLAEDLTEFLQSQEALWTDDSRAGEAAQMKVKLAGRPWLIQARPLESVAGNVAGAVVCLASVDARLRPYHRLRLLLVVAGLVAMLLSGAVTYVVGGRLIRPLRTLAASARAISGGDDDREIEAAGTDDEVGEVSEAMAKLLAELRHKRDMEVYVGQLATNLQEEADAAETTQADSATIVMEDGFAPEVAQPAATPARDSGIRAGDLLGDRFEIHSVLGSGGMGVVYKARDRQLDEFVALKILKHQEWTEASNLDDLKREIKLARQISHPNVLRTFDFGILDEIPFISMEYVRGVTLRAFLDQSGPLPLSAGLRLARQLCSGLAAAHGQGVLHLDIKPENLIIDQTGNARLMDFGVARSTRRSWRQKPGSGVVVGTPAYLAPEQLEGVEPGERADIYSCGLVFCEIFTGELPLFARSSLGGRTSSQRQQLLEKALGSLPQVLREIISRCLERDPDHRYRDVRALLEQLEAFRP